MCCRKLYPDATAGKDDGQGANAADFTDDIYESALTDAGAGMFGGDVSTSRGSKGSIAESLLTESELTSLRDLIPDPGGEPRLNVKQSFRLQIHVKHNVIIVSL